MKKVKPMLAVEVDFNKLRYPCYVSPKLDGVRCIIKDGMVLSRSLKPIPNKYVQELFSHLEGVDGELIVGDPLATDVFQKTTSGVMSRDGEPDVILYAFDLWNDERVFTERFKKLAFMMKHCDNTRLVGNGVCYNQEQVEQEAEFRVAEGFEGIMLRDPSKSYKYGRSTKNSQELLKWKPFEDDEFEIVGFVERMHNTNEAKTNELGYTERSLSKEGMVPTGMLGALVLKFGEDTFECGTGFSDAQRKEMWDNKESYLGKLAKIRYQKSGMKDKPRFPSFQGIRDPKDLC